MNIVCKTFEELTTTELYQLLRLRSEVFVVEQNCVYQDIDNKDQKALHVLGIVSETIVGYTRIFNKGDYFDKASIGRVVVAQNFRKLAFGHKIMKFSIDFVENKLGENEIKISAQEYLIKFYNQHCFQQVGEGYLEDGIPHVGMLRKVIN